MAKSGHGGRTLPSRGGESTPGVCARAMRLALAIFLAACGGTTTPPPACGPTTCQGCCHPNGSCQDGTDKYVCGQGGESCLSCGQGRLCINKACGVEALPAGAKLVFITRGDYAGNLGGLSGADSLCAGAAAAGNLPGRFKAWLSVNGPTTTNASERFTSDGPWYLPGVDMDGRRRLVFPNRASLKAPPRVPIRVTEILQEIPTTGRNVWTGTLSTGLAPTTSSGTCAAWTSSTNFESGLKGTVFGTGGDWTQFSSGANCESRLGLYCFED